jgi:phage terminase large subunit GpA-like protein
LKNKADDWGSESDNPTVPHGVRCLVATVDVQNAAFVVQISGFTAEGDLVVVDSFKLRLSDRVNSRGERLPIDPAAYGEDWKVLKREVMDLSYPLADGSGRRMRIRATGCDSGGKEGVTGHAYNFWRQLRADGSGDHRRFMLIKGEPSKTAPEVQTKKPDSSQKGKGAIAKGDVPVIFLNSNRLKDRVFLLMSRRVSEDATEGGLLKYPNWIPDWFYVQMTSEIRTEKGWENTRKRRNEAFDLTYYAIGMTIRPVETDSPHVHFGLDRLKSTPIWFEEWDKNEFVFSEAVEQVEAPKKKRASLAELGEKLG